MKLNKLILLLIFLILISSVNAFIIGDAKCYKDGSLTLMLSGSEDDKVYTKDLIVKATQLTWYDLPVSSFEVNGVWDRNRINGYVFGYFKSDEALFNAPGKYLIEVKYNDQSATYNLEDCIGLMFSCKLINIAIKNCSTVDNKYFSALLKINGVEQSDISKINYLEDIYYELEAEQRYEDYRNKFSTVGDWPKGFKVNKLSENEYFFSYEFENNFIKSIKAEFKGLSECKTDNITLSDRKDCNIIESKKENKLENITEESPNKITGAIVKEIPKRVVSAKKEGSNWIYWLICGFVVTLTIVIIIILKNKKVNKWV